MENVTSRDGTTIAFDRLGEGPPIVLVTGGSVDRMSNVPLAQELASDFTVLNYDRRGRGPSGDTLPYAIEREFEDIAAVVDAIDEPVNLLGHSYGAVCSLETALRTSNIGKLVVYEPPMPMPGARIASEDTLARIEDLVARGELEQALVTFMREVAGMPPEQLDVMRSLPQWQRRIPLASTLVREQRLEYDYRPDLDTFAAISIPTLLLVGTESPPTLTEPSAMLAKIIPNARLVELSGQAHAAMDTASEMFVDEVGRFLSES